MGLLVYFYCKSTINIYICILSILMIIVEVYIEPPDGGMTSGACNHHIPTASLKDLQSIPPRHGHPSDPPPQPVLQ